MTTPLHCNSCQNAIDLSTIPDDAFYSELARRRSARRLNHSGGTGGDRVWAEHNPDAPKGCRCEYCRAERLLPVHRTIRYLHAPPKLKPKPKSTVKFQKTLARGKRQ